MARVGCANARLRLAGLALLLAGVIGCGGKSEGGVGSPSDKTWSYCDAFPSDMSFCDGDAGEMGIGEALRRVDEADVRPADAFLVTAQSVHLSPDGTRVSEGESWQFTFSLGGPRFLEVSVYAGRVETDEMTTVWECDPSDEISVDGFAEQIQMAVSKLRRDRGVVYEPGMFVLMGGRLSRCTSGVGYESTRVMSMTGENLEVRYSMEFSQAHPDGMFCNESFFSVGCTAPSR